MDGGAWKATVHGVTKSQTRLSNFTFTFHFHALEKGMATHSSIVGLENPRDKGACWAAIYGVAQSRTWLPWLSSRRILTPLHRSIFWMKVNTNNTKYYLQLKRLIYKDSGTHDWIWGFKNGKSQYTDFIAEINKSNYLKSFYYHLKSFHIFCTFSVQFSCSVMSQSLQPHGLQHARSTCPSQNPGSLLTYIH